MEHPISSPLQGIFTHTCAGRHLRATAMRYTRGCRGSLVTTNLERSRRIAPVPLYRYTGAQQWCSAHSSRDNSTNASSLRFEQAAMTIRPGFRALPTAALALPGVTSNTTVCGKVFSSSTSNSRRGLLTSSGSFVPQTTSSGRVLVESGVVSPRRTVPDDIPKTPYYTTAEVPPPDNMVRVFLGSVEPR